MCEAYSGTWDENGVQIAKGSRDVYYEALQSGDENSDNLEFLYEAACTCKEKITAQYEIFKEYYESKSDVFGKAYQNENINSEINNIKEDYNVISESYNSFIEEDVLESPDEYIPEDDRYILYNIWISEEGYFDGNPEAPEYWFVDTDGVLTCGDEENWSLKYEYSDSTGAVLTLKNFNFTSNPEYECNAIYSEVSLTIIAEGKNSITACNGNTLGVNGKLVTKGSGTLELIATSEKISGVNEESGEGYEYVPQALSVGGGLDNSIDISCDSKNDDCTVYIDCNSQDILNSGTVSVGEGQYIGTWDGLCSKLVKPASYQSIADYPVPTDHDYVAKVYTYSSDVMYPNLIYDYGDDDSVYTIVGRYDEDGKPIGSKVSYQYWYVDKRGGILTEDIKNPMIFLVYDDNPEALIQDKDIVGVQDGEKHTFNADLYCLWFNDGDVTVNGNIIVDLALSNAELRELVESDEGEDYFEYVTDENGQRLYSLYSTENSNVTVNGNVGLVSLNDSYAGNLTVNGNVDSLGYYWDTKVKTTLEDVPADYYGSVSNAGQVVKNGEYIGIADTLDGYQGYCVYNTEDFYTMTEREIDGEAVNGTTAAVNGDPLLVDVSRSVVGNLTYPCVKTSDASTKEKVEGILTDTDSKLTVMDISLIQDNTKKVEPETSLNLYIDKLTGFDKPAVYHIKDDGEIEKLFVYDGNGTFGGNIICKTNSFSTYFVAEDQELKSTNINETSAADTEAPATTEAPDVTEAPATTEAPAATEAPDATEAPATTGTPVATEAPVVTVTPATEATATTEASKTPETTVTTATSNTQSPKTSDTADLLVVGIMLIISIFGLAYMATGRKH